MSTVDDAVEAGARALSEHWRDMHTNESLGQQRMLSGHAARAMWPVLSARLRELHKPEIRYQPYSGYEYSFDTAEVAVEFADDSGVTVADIVTFEICAECGRIEMADDPGRNYSESLWPCPTMQAIYETDKELGL